MTGGDRNYHTSKYTDISTENGKGPKTNEYYTTIRSNKLVNLFFPRYAKTSSNHVFQQSIDLDIPYFSMFSLSVLPRKALACLSILRVRKLHSQLSYKFPQNVKLSKFPLLYYDLMLQTEYRKRCSVLAIGIGLNILTTFRYLFLLQHIDHTIFLCRF